VFEMPFSGSTETGTLKALTAAVRSVRLRIGRFEAGNETSLLRPLIRAVVNGFVEEVSVLWLPLTWGIVREIQQFGRHSEGLRRFEQVECL
jgi:hypothetical protein